MVGLDTGYFIKLLEGHGEAAEVWSGIMDGDEATVSCLTLFELARLARRGAIATQAEATLREGIGALCHLSWLDKPDNLLLGADLSHGLGIPAVDALILAAFVAAGATVIYTADGHLEAYRKKGVRVTRL
ncbi:MAG: type II toxin-antitoxin system VapC family toxin [Chloroflexi bacterium]|nr:type II toxin-antitoxin system VapC family toxin [Chloroflexota bacterium]